ncbi:2,3-diaminopropionate biosynthesis protein SbnB [Streptomyces fructofermentans]|uniref:2,3-diaminopropionate biosynthesis protein SbnB n=1 Tax=Streptomyces fructofermentans TaxID=152141 RepID=UPI0033FD5A45
MTATDTADGASPESGAAGAGGTPGPGTDTGSTDTGSTGARDTGDAGGTGGTGDTGNARDTGTGRATVPGPRPARPAPAPGALGPPPFTVVPGSQVGAALEGREPEIADLVEQVYRLHDAGDSVNPPSYFLRFADRPSSRIIALPASIGGQLGVDGIKWISSFPGNTAAGLPRASAVLILNDPETGYPFACLESSIISATRTAASAALAADRLSRGRPRPARVGFVGTGLIARYVHTHLTATGWSFEETGVHDLSAGSAAGFRGYLERSGAKGRITVHDSAEELIRSSDLLVFATVAAEPHVHDPGWFGHAPLVLHVSLRDLAPEILLASANFVDDVEHCLKAETSPHLAERLTGGRDFLDGTLADVLAGRVTAPADRTVVFSPFGLGVLDLAVGRFVHDEVTRHGEPHVVDGFFHELRRYG